MLVDYPQILKVETHSLHSPLIPWIDPKKFTMVTSLLRKFFISRGFHEAHTQNRLSILAACEDPKTIATYEFGGKVWPLPQTGQMWLEYELLSRPSLPGVFCLSTSYRSEPNPIAGRHAWIFPMFEFELHGGLDALMQLEKDLLEELGFGRSNSYGFGRYQSIAEEYGVKEIDRTIEERIGKEKSPIFFLTHFPEYSNPFWNMKRSDEDGFVSSKIDVLLYGMETIGSAERSCDPMKMRELFYSIEEGRYANQLFKLFEKERVEEELQEFLSLPFIQRSGAGMGVTRLIRAMELHGLI